MIFKTKRKFRALCALCAVFVILTLSACSGKGGAYPDPADVNPDVTPSAAAQAEAGYVITPGIWISYIDGAEDTYFYFYPEGDPGDTEDTEGTYNGSGRTSDPVYGYGTSFVYEHGPYEGGSADSLIFHFGSIDDNTPAEVTVKDSEHITLKMDETTYELEYFTDDISLVWYTNTELEEMAQNYYTANNSGYVPGGVFSETQPDGTVRIRLYDPTDDHDVTAAMYLVSRVSASGYDEVTEEHVDLKPYAPEN